MEHYEKLYIEETGDKKPELINERLIITGNNYWAIKRWYERFSLWLCKRLEKMDDNHPLHGLLSRCWQTEKPTKPCIVLMKTKRNNKPDAYSIFYLIDPADTNIISADEYLILEEL